MDLLTIGELSARSGVAASALRYYERVGLIHLGAHQRQPAPVRPNRTAPGGVHPYRPAGRGILDDIADALASLPDFADAHQGGLGSIVGIVEDAA